MPSYVKQIKIKSVKERNILRKFNWAKVAERYKTVGRTDVRSIPPLEIMRMIACMMRLPDMTLQQVAFQLKRDQSMIGNAYRTYGRLLHEVPRAMVLMFGRQKAPYHHLTFDDARSIFRAELHRREQVAKELFEARKGESGLLRMARNIE